MSRYFIISGLLLCLLLMGPFGCGGGDDEDDEDCPRFKSYQIYPEVGGANTEFELLVVLKTKSENQKISTIDAKLYHSDGRSANQTLDMVRSNADPYRFVRAFKGSDVCEEGTCKYFFQVVATHAGGCIKAFKSDVFVVQMDEDTTDDDDDNV